MAYGIALFQMTLSEWLSRSSTYSRPLQCDFFVQLCSS